MRTGWNHACKHRLPFSAGNYGESSMLYDVIMRSLTLTATISSCFLIALSGCSNSSPQDSADSNYAEATTSSPTREPLSPGDDLTIECHDAENQTFTNFSTPEEAWKAPRENRERCGAQYNSQVDLWDDSFFNDYVLTDTEEEALEVSEYDDPTSISTLYSICAEADLGDLSQDSPWSSGQIAEVNGALVLCPDHPDRKEVEKRMKKGNEEEEARERGEIFNSGTYKVGVDIQPGTYVAESETPFENCYWERLDSSGEIIDNNFINSGFRVEVSIRSSDYSFTAEGCGEWVKQ